MGFHGHAQSAGLSGISNPLHWPDYPIQGLSRVALAHTDPTGASGEPGAII